jgi:cleavage and polyadenylation specificity factor subunit 2
VTAELQDGDAIIEKLLVAFERGGSVLIPVSTGARTIELILQIDRHWDRNRDRLEPYSIVWLGNMTHLSLEFAKSHLEWMPEALRSNFERNPFELDYVKVLQTEEDLPANPACILATTETMECGFSRSLFVKLAGDASNMLLFVEPPIPGTFAAQVSEMAAGESAELERPTLFERTGDMVTATTEEPLSAVITEAELQEEEMIVEPEDKPPFPMFPRNTFKSNPDQYGEFCTYEWE